MGQAAVGERWWGVEGCPVVAAAGAAVLRLRWGAFAVAGGCSGRDEAAFGMSHAASATFKVTLSVKKEPHGGPVYCKMDGARFKQAKTVKLHTDTTYRIDVSFKPPRSLESMVVLGQEMEAVERWRDSTASAYSGYYTTQGIPPSRKGQREDMPIVMRVKETGELTTCLQIKFYRQADVQHCEWGSRLHCIELDCSAAEGSLSVTESGDSVDTEGIPFFIATQHSLLDLDNDLDDQHHL